MHREFRLQAVTHIRLIKKIVRTQLNIRNTSWMHAFLAVAKLLVICPVLYAIATGDNK